MARSVEFDVVANDRASRTLDSVAQASDQTGGKLSKLGGVAKGAGVALAAVGAAAGVAGKYMFDTAVNVEAMGNKARVVFGDYFPKAQKEAEALGSALGMSTSEVLGLTAGFGDLLTPMGFSQKRAQEMSGEMGTLTAALAQWSGGTKTAADVGDILADALTGEYDSLKSLGVQLDADTVKSKLAAQGKDKLKGEALKQATAEIALAEITKQSSNALEGYEKKTNKLGLAKNQLMSKLKNLRDTIASKLIPVFANIVTWINDKAIPAVSRFWRDHLPQFRAAWDRVTEVASRFSSWIKNDLMPGIRSTLDTVMPLFKAALDNIKKAFDSGGKSGTDWGRVISVAGDVIEGVLRAVLVAASALALGFSLNMKALGWAVNNVAKPAAKALWRVFETQFGLIVDAAAAAFGWIPGIGPKLKEAQRQFRAFRDKVNAALNGIRDRYVNVNVRTVYSGGDNYGRKESTNGRGGRAVGGGLMIGAEYRVNEAGQEMLKVNDRSAAVIPHAQSQRMLRAGGGGGGEVHNHFNLSGIIAPDRQSAARMLRSLMREAEMSGVAG